MKKKRKILFTIYAVFSCSSILFLLNLMSTYEVSYFLGIQIRPAQLEEEADQCQALNIAMVVAGYETTNRAIVLVKSLLNYYNKPIFFHFITDHRSMDVLPELFGTWELADVKYAFYDSERFIEHVQWIPNNHYSRHFGLIKLLLADILPRNLERVLLLDTDLLIVGSIDDLIANFDNLKNGKIYGLAENLSRWYTTQDPVHHVWPARGSGFNTGVALVNLAQMRRVDWNRIWRNVAEANLRNFGKTMLADQDILNAIFVDHPEYVHKISCHYNVQLGLNSQPELCRANLSDFKVSKFIVLAHKSKNTCHKCKINL